MEIRIGTDKETSKLTISLYSPDEILLRQYKGITSERAAEIYRDFSLVMKDPSQFDVLFPC